MELFPQLKSSHYLPPFPPPIPSHSDSTSFPIIAIAIIGILATAFLLLSYYVFVINCCLNWHRIDLLRRLSLSSRRRRPPPTTHSPPIHTRGLDESVIRSIPLVQYKNSIPRGKTSSECSVCLSEFGEDETVRIIPICSHLFHIDCIDIWLQNNPNCPLCRTTISSSTLFHRFPLPTSSPADPIGGGNERDFVVIELGGIRNDPSGQLSQERPNSGECPATTGKLEQGKKRRKLQKVTSLGDEWIDTREKDERFCVQPIRRSVSMDSSAERQMYLAVQAALRGSTASPGGDGCHGRGRRSLFSFGNGMSCRNGVEVQAVRLEES
ncbi:RING-H2 finger protein ATL16, partial [Cucurbita argyrosperma subsp. argyrosperma]